MDTKLFATLGLLFTLVAACGGKALDLDAPPEGSGGDNQAGSGAAGKAHGGSGQGGSGTGGFGAGGSMGGVGSGGSGGAACSAFDDASPGFIPVEIVNATSSTLHLGQDTLSCSVEPLFSVGSDAGPLGIEGSCRTSCSALRAGGPVGCPAICAFPSTVKLLPGETYRTSWDARYFVAIELPAACDAGYGRQCSQARVIQPGSFTFTAKAGSSIDCPMAHDARCAPCQPTENGGCTTPGSFIGGTLATAHTNVVLDGSYGIYGKQLPMPRPDIPDADFAPPLSRVVRIIFGDLR